MIGVANHPHQGHPVGVSRAAHRRETTVRDQSRASMYLTNWIAHQAATYHALLQTIASAPHRDTR